MEERIEHLIARMILEERASLVVGRDFECYSEDQGKFELFAGSSSRDIRLVGCFRLKGDPAA